MYARITKIYFIKAVGHVFTKPVQRAHHQEVRCIYTTVRHVLCCSVDPPLANPANRQSKEHQNTYQLLYIYRYRYLYIYSTSPDDGLQICPKHVEVD